jgi:hypothetical protein
MSAGSTGKLASRQQWLQDAASGGLLDLQLSQVMYNQHGCHAANC